MAFRLDAPNPQVHSPEWWLKRLWTKLAAQQKICYEFESYHAGIQPLAMASRKFAETFGDRYRRLPANLMPLVVDAERERLNVQGFRFGANPSGDKAAWKIWQDNQMDAESQIAHETALVKTVAFTMVVKGPDGPLITVEDPSEVTLETLPGNRRIREAALKVWTDDEGYVRAYLFLPDLIYKYRTEKPTEMGQTFQWSQVNWLPYADEGEDWPLTNQQGVVPIVPLLNRPDIKGVGRSEIEPVMGNQNAINKIRFDALVASEYVAFPQRWATNIDIPIDEDTGKPVAPFRPGVDQLWATRRPTPEDMQDYGVSGPPNPAFGQFPAADLRPYIDMERQEVGLMASISRTPYHYLLGEPTSIPPSGESIKSSEAALVRKVMTQSVHFGEGWEETMRLALVLNSQSSKAEADGETIWSDPETRNEAAHTDAILKQYAAGLLPDSFALEELGYSVQQVERINTMKAADAAKEAALPAEIDAAAQLLKAVKTGTLGVDSSVNATPGGTPTPAPATPPPPSGAPMK